jgi:dTDP-4-dehydrorhamnose reductase
MTDPILVFGAGGQLGQEMLALTKELGVEARGLARTEVDITNRDAVERAVEQVKPRLVLNAAAYTAVDKAEDEITVAEACNVKGAENISLATAKLGIPIVHISTDYVFDGIKPTAYVETDPVSPLGAYGRTKAEGEEAVRRSNPNNIVLRTSWVFGRYGANFLKTMLRLARERDALRVVADQYGRPTSTRDIAEAILAVDRALDKKAVPWGTYHFSGSVATTWHGFAKLIVDAQAPHTGRKPTVAAITTAEYPTPAKRPANSELDSSLFTATFGYKAADLLARIQETVAALNPSHRE